VKTFSEYQAAAATTAIYPKTGMLGLTYVALGLGEVGEVQGKIKKIIRDNACVITDEAKKEIGKELGDVLWYLANMCTELDLDFGEIAQSNLDKLASRKERGVLQGSGDNR
jgi:NTP pyrophosphatase (non-canonical NTP hydrolase)